MASIANRFEFSQKLLADLADTVTQRVSDARRQATQRADLRLGSLREGALTSALSAGSAALGGIATSARALPFSENVCDALDTKANALAERERALTQPAIEGYDELNVREVGEALSALNAWGLQKVRRYEEAHKNRKTVLGAIERLMR